MAEVLANRLPRRNLAEESEGNDLKEPIIYRAIVVIVRDVPNQILGHSICGTEDIAELEAPKNWVIGPRW